MELNEQICRRLYRQEPNVQTYKIKPTSTCRRKLFKTEFTGTNSNIQTYKTRMTRGEKNLIFKRTINNEWIFHRLVACTVCFWTPCSVTHPIKKHLFPTLHLPQCLSAPPSHSHKRTDPHTHILLRLSSLWLISLFSLSGFISFHHSPSGSIFSKPVFLMVPNFFF